MLAVLNYVMIPVSCRLETGRGFIYIDSIEAAGRIRRISAVFIGSSFVSSAARKIPGSAVC